MTDELLVALLHLKDEMDKSFYYYRISDGLRDTVDQARALLEQYEELSNK